MMTLGQLCWVLAILLALALITIAICLWVIRSRDAKIANEPSEKPSPEPSRPSKEAPGEPRATVFPSADSAEMDAFSRTMETMFPPSQPEFTDLSQTMVSMQPGSRTEAVPGSALAEFWRALNLMERDEMAAVLLYLTQRLAYPRGRMHSNPSMPESYTIMNLTRETHRRLLGRALARLLELMKE